MKIQIILGSTRPGRIGKNVADWVYAEAGKRSDIVVELVDVADFNLPLLDEPVPPSMGEHTKDHTKKWGSKISEADGYVFVTAEYNHSIPGAFKNAIDFLYKEWNDKAVGFVSYGSNGGSRAVEHLRGLSGEVRLADVREQLMLYLANDFENHRVFTPAVAHAAQLTKVLDQLVRWTKAMQGVRAADKQKQS